MTTNRQMRVALDRALGKLKAKHGSLSAGVRKLGLPRQRLQKWRERGRVSHVYMRALADETGMSIYELRPDIVGSAPADDDLAAAA